MAYKDIYEQEMGRRKVNEALMQQAFQSNRTEQAGGRVVPYGLGEGMAQIGKALIARGAMDASEDRLSAARKEREGKQQEIVAAAMGQPGETAPLLGPNEFPGGTQEISPEIAPDLQKAALMAAGDSDTAPMAKVLQAMIKSKGGRGQYFTPRETVVPDGEGGFTVIKESYDHRTGQWIPEQSRMSPASPVVQGAISSAKAGGKIAGETKAQAEVDLPQAEITSQETERLVDELVEHPGMKDVIGFPDNPFAAKGLVPGTAAADFRGRLKQITGRTFMEIFPTLKGGGQITEIEGEKGQQSINRMASATTEKEFVKAANDFKQEIKRLKALVRERAGLPPEEETMSKEERYQAYKKRMLSQ